MLMAGGVLREKISVSFCIYEEKLLLWDRLSLVIKQNSGKNLCLIGDFNSILDEVERVGSSGSSSSRDRRKFKEFVDSCNLLDVKLRGMKFTWYKSNDSCKSRIDRALLNEKWVETWTGSSLRGLKRSVSDHCAILLSTTEASWAPKPFRFINVWLTHPNFKEVVKASWKEGGISGWGSFVFNKESQIAAQGLEQGVLREYGPLDLNIHSLREEIHSLDMIDETSGLSAADVCLQNKKSA